MYGFILKRRMLVIEYYVNLIAPMESVLIEIIWVTKREIFIIYLSSLVTNLTDILMLQGSVFNSVLTINLLTVKFN